MLKQRDIILQLKKGTTYPLYLFSGEEEFLIRETVDLIVGAVVDPASRDFNFNVLYCRDTTAAELVNLAQTLPFMAKNRLIIAKEIDAFKASDIEELMSYLNDPSPSTCLVMIANQAKYDKKAVIAAVEAHGAVVRFYPLLDEEVVAWIEGWARVRGLSLQRDVSQYLWQLVGNDLQKIKNELEKVEIYIKEKKSITFDDVKAVVGNFREYSTFDLAAALGQRNREKAFLILSQLIQEGDSPVGLLGSIAWNFRRLMLAKAMEANGIGYEEIKRKLKPPVIFHQSASFKKQMKTFTMEELSRVFEIMKRADLALKSSGLNGRLVLERMILKLCDAADMRK